MYNQGIVNAVAMLIGEFSNSNKKRLVDCVQLLWNSLEASFEKPSPRNQDCMSPEFIPVGVIDFELVIPELVALLSQTLYGAQL